NGLERPALAAGTVRLADGSASGPSARRAATDGPRHAGGSVVGRQPRHSDDRLLHGELQPEQMKQFDQAIVAAWAVPTGIAVGRLGGQCPRDARRRSGMSLIVVLVVLSVS